MKHVVNPFLIKIEADEEYEVLIPVVWFLCFPELLFFLEPCVWHFHRI